MAENLPFDITPPGAKIDMFPSPPDTPSDGDAISRALKYHYAMGEGSPGQDAVYNSIISGQEDNLRANQAMDQSLKDKHYQLDMLKTYLADHKGPITDQALSNFQQLTAPKNPNPQVDMEKAFSSKMIDELYFPEGSIFRQAAELHPHPVSQFYNVLKDNMTKLEIVRKKIEDTNKTYTTGKDPNGNITQQWWNDFAETMIPFKSWATIATAGDSGHFFLGANLADQVRKAQMMPLDEFQKYFTSTYDAIATHNPLDAQHFAEAFISYGNSSEFWDTAGGLGDIASVVPAGLAVKGVKAAAKGTTAALSLAKTFDIPSILSSAGKTADAAKAIALKDIRDNFRKYEKGLTQITSSDIQGDVKRLIEQTPTFSNPLSFIKGGSLREDVPIPPVKILKDGEIPITFEKGPSGTYNASITKDFTVDLNSLPKTPKQSPWSITLDGQKNQVFNGGGHAYTNFDINKGEDLGVGTLRVALDPKDPKDLYISYVSVDNAGHPGPAEVRGLLRQLKQHFPEVETLSGLRVSGARTGHAVSDKPPRREGDHFVGLGDYPDVQIKLHDKAMETKPITATQGENFAYGTQNVKLTTNIKIPATPKPNLTREFANRIGNSLLEQGVAALNGIADRNAIERLPVTPEAEAIARAFDFAQQEFNHIGDGVVDLGHYIPPEENIANIGQIVVYLKRPDALPFDRAEQAARFAETEYKLPRGTYDIKNEGNGWYITVVRPIDETQPTVRDLLIETGNDTKRNLINTMFGNLRSAEDVNSIDVRTGRKTAAHSIQDQYRTLKEIVQPIRDLSKQSKRDFIRFTEALRDYENNGTRGRFFNTMRDMETEWQNMFGHLPTDKEILAYGSYLRAYEWDYIWRNIGVYRSLTRQGIRDFQIAKADGTLTTAFKGRQVQGIDWHSNASILVQDQFPAMGRAGDAGIFDAQLRSLIDVSLSTGEYKVIQLAQPQALPLKAELGINDLIEFVIVKNFKSDRIAMNQIPFRPGGHVLYNYDFFIKQPRSMWAGSRNLYTHDTTVRPMSLRADAERMIPLYTEAQRLYRLRDPGFDAYANANIPEGAQRLRSAFDTGSLSSTEPFFIAKRGQSGWSSNEVRNHYNSIGGVENYQSSPNNLYQTVNHEYAGERNYDIATGNGRGSEENPVFRLDRPKLIDPLATINRAMATLARNTSLEDFRYMAAEHFVQEFQNALKTPLDQLRSNPIAHIFDPKWNEDAPRDIVAAGKHFQRSFIDFLHVQTDWGKNMGWFREKVYELTVHTLGEARADAIANNKLIKAIQDPIHAVRSLAFVEHLGVFNPAQYWKQLQTLTHMTGIAGPRIAGKSVPVAYLMRALMMTNESPAMLDHFAGMAEKFGWNRAHFVEAYTNLRKTGLDIVEGEHAWKDDLGDPQLFSGKTAQYLNKNTIFFKEGERQTRFASFNAAYLQWKEANPEAVLDRRALQHILVRQDLMNGNMTRASNAAWQSMGRGILSVPLQFATYPIRIMEQFVSNRLTGAERARLLITYSALYGIPVGIGITPLGIYPFYQDLQQHLLENGITEDPNPIIETLHKGILETAFHMIGGRQYNAGEALGVGGLQITKDMFQGTFMEVALGASGSTVGGILESTVPLYHDIAGVFFDGVDGKAPLIAADFGDALRNVSSINAAYKMYFALAYGKYISRGETYVDQMSPFDAVLSTVFGVSPQSMDDIGREIESNKEMKSAQAFAEKEMVKYLRRGFQTDPSDTKTRESYFRMAEAWRVLGDFQYDQYPAILERATNGVESLASQLNNSFFWKNAPASQQQERTKALMDLSNSNGGNQ